MASHLFNLIRRHGQWVCRRGHESCCTRGEESNMGIPNFYAGDLDLPNTIPRSHWRIQGRHYRNIIIPSLCDWVQTYPFAIRNTRPHIPLPSPIPPRISLWSELCHVGCAERIENDPYWRRPSPPSEHFSPSLQPPSSSFCLNPQIPRMLLVYFLFFFVIFAKITI